VTPRLPALLLTGALLAACGGGTDPADVRRADVAAMTAAANDGDADGVRRHADALLATVAVQLEAQHVTADEAERLTALAESVRASADLIDDDLLERQRAEAEAEQARQELAEAERRLEEERARAEEAARQAEADREADEDKGPKDDEKKDEDKEGD